MTLQEKDAIFTKIKTQLKLYMNVSVVSFVLVLIFLITSFFITLNTIITGIITLLLVVVLIYLILTKRNMIKSINFLISNENKQYGKDSLVFKSAIRFLSQKNITCKEFISSMQAKN